MKPERIIVSEKSINKAIEKTNGFEQKNFDKAINNLMEEQPALSSFLYLISEDSSEEYFDIIIDEVLTIWYSYKNEVKVLPEITFETFDLVNSRQDKTEKDLIKALKLKNLKQLTKKLNNFNIEMSNAKTENDVKIFAEKMGDEFEIILNATMTLTGQIYQPWLFDYIRSVMEDEAQETEEIENMFSHLMMVINCFDLTINPEPIMIIPPDVSYN